LAAQHFPSAKGLSNDDGLLTIGLAQIAPVWLDRGATLAKVDSYVERAARQGCKLVVFGEALAPGYPFWLELTDGARFNSALQKTVLPNTRLRPFSQRPGISIDSAPLRHGTASPSTGDAWSAPPTGAGTAFTARWFSSINGAKLARSTASSCRRTRGG